jgi:hypothetical protein
MPGLAAWTDASYARLTNLALSFTLQDKILKKWGSSFFKFYIQGQNLLVITGYKGLDPETQRFGQMPPAKIITGGLQMKF